MTATRAGPNDWLSAEQVDSDGHAAYRLNVNIVGGTGGAVTIAGPLGTQTGAASVAVTPATASSWAITAAQLPILGPQAGAASLSVVPNTDTAFTVVGNVASAAADSGNPVKVGGKYNSSLPTFTNGQRGDLQIGPSGQLYVGPLIAGFAVTGGNLTSDAIVASSTVGQDVRAFNYLFNGTTEEKMRGNLDPAALITATGATTTQTGADQTNMNGRGVQIVLDMTNVGTGSVTLTIQGKDVASGKYYTLLAGLPIITISTNVYTVYPGAAATANVSANTPLPRTWRVLVTANNANATTYTVGASVIV